MTGLRFALVTIFLLGAILAEVVIRKEVNPEDLDMGKKEDLGEAADILVIRKEVNPKYLDMGKQEDLESSQQIEHRNIDESSQQIEHRNIDVPKIKDIGGIYLKDSSGPSNVDSIIDERDHYIAPAHRDIADDDGFREIADILRTHKDIDVPKIKSIGGPSNVDSIIDERDHYIAPAHRDIDDDDGFREIADILRTHKVINGQRADIHPNGIRIRAHKVING